MHSNSHHHADYRRSLEDVLSPAERESLTSLCRKIGAEVIADNRLAELNRIGRDYPDWTPIIATALATDIDRVEAMMQGGAPIPGARQRLRASLGVRTYAEQRQAQRREEEQAMAAAKRKMRDNARRHATTGRDLPDGWLDAANAGSAIHAATALGMTHRSGKLGPCPACGAERRGSTDKRLPINADDNLWHCRACNQGGTPTHLACYALFGRRRFTSRDEARRLGAFFFGAGLL